MDYEFIDRLDAIADAMIAVAAHPDCPDSIKAAIEIMSRVAMTELRKENARRAIAALTH